jgi:hypothetical protein
MLRGFLFVFLVQVVSLFVGLVVGVRGAMSEKFVSKSVDGNGDGLNV